MFVAKTENGKPVIGADGQIVLIEIPDPIPNEEIDRRIKESAAAAAAAAATQTRTEFENDRLRREQEMETRMREREEAARISALPEAEQMRERMRMLETQNRDHAQALANQAAQHGQQIRQLGLVAYRERAARDVPQEVEYLVMGNTEEEIDQSVDAANRAYQQISETVTARLTEQFQQGHLSATPAQPTVLQVVPQGPRTPHVTAPPVPGGGYPTPTQAANPPAPTEAPEEEMRYQTTEEAVRSGRYGDVRHKLLRSVQGTKYPGSMGAQPRHWSQPSAQTVPHTTMPGDVQQPQGLATPQAQNPHVAAPPPAQPDVRAAALDANTRARNSDVHVQNHLASDAGRAHRAGPQSQYSARFQHTPPVSQGN